MKSVLLIVLVIVGCFCAAALGLRELGAAVRAADVIPAAVAAVVAGLAGIAPLVFGQRADPGSQLNRAMLGTMLHMLVMIALAVSVLAIHPHDQRRPLIFWVLGGYWVSLLAVVWQSRSAIILTSNTFRSTTTLPSH